MIQRSCKHVRNYPGPKTGPERHFYDATSNVTSPRYTPCRIADRLRSVARNFGCGHLLLRDLPAHRHHQELREIGGLDEGEFEGLVKRAGQETGDFELQRAGVSGVGCPNPGSGRGGFAGVETQTRSGSNSAISR